MKTTNKPQPHDLETLAVMFRTNDPNLGHVSTLETMTNAGLAYTYGLYRGIPRNQRRRLRAMRETIATALERKAISDSYQAAIDNCRASKELR